MYVEKKYPYNCFVMNVLIIANGTSVSAFLYTRKLGPEDVHVSVTVV